jgi:predicted phage replisome organizer
MAEYRKDKYYWFKLKDDFFKRHDIKIIKSMPNGKDYVIFYLQLLCESLSHDGKLRFNEEVPYNEDMLAIITDTNIDVVRSAMKLFEQLKLVEILDDQTIYMTKLQNMIGNTTIGAEKKMLQREKSTQLLGGGQKVDKCPPEIEKEIEIEKDIYINNNKKEINNKETVAWFDNPFGKKVLDLLQIPEISKETYFKTLKLLICEGEEVVFEAPKMIARAIDQNYKEKFEGAIANASNGEFVGYRWKYL